MFGQKNTQKVHKGYKVTPTFLFFEESTEFCSYLGTLTNLSDTVIQLFNLFKILL